MAGGELGRGWRRLVCAAVALYALVLAVAPFEHHDLLCHLKTPQHCVSCSSNAASLHPDAPNVLEGRQLFDAGRAFATVATGIDVLLVAVSSGRSPPASL
jgi:hypothetical protein